MRAKLRRLRCWGPFIVACGCLVVAGYVPPFAAYVLVIAAFALLFEAATAWFERSGGTGGLKDFRQ
jgi:uncharacterized membrane protein YphA (DoxX/SURF4 family)